MKQRRKFILFYLSIICLFSCTAPYPNTILRVENIIKEYPDSALTILDSLSESITKESQSAKMYYYLLLTEARDRNMGKDFRPSEKPINDHTKPVRTRKI